MKIFLIANGNVNNQLLKELKKNLNPDVIIAVNGGTNKALKANIKPDIIIGDTDSLKNRYKKKFPALNIIKHPKDKDKSDLDLAIDFILSNYSNFTIFCFGIIGSRIDHSLASLNSISKIENNFIITSKETLLILSKNKLIRDITHPTKLSVISLSIPYSKVRMEGLKYSGKYEIPFLSSLGISNITESNKNLIECQEGKILIILYNKITNILK